MAKFGRARAKRLVVDIGSSAIRLCELVPTKAGYQLAKYYQREVLVDPLLDDEAKRKLRSTALKALLKEAKVRTRKTVVAVPGRSVFTRTRTLPPVPEYKVTQIVRYEIQQQIPFALDQIALDYQILTRTEGGGYDVMMAAIKVDVVDKQLDVLRESKCRIDTVDVCPLADYNWLKHTGEFGAEGECVALLDLGACTTDIIIERGGQFRFTRPLNLAGDDVTSAIRDAFGINFADAERMKRERGFAPTGDPKRDGKLGEVIGQVLGRLVTEINRSFAYFRSLPGGGTIDRIIVTGGGACLRNIIPYFQRQFGVEVRIARPTAGLTIAPSAQEINEHPERSAVVLGMALRLCEPVPIAINLIPPAVLEAARRREQVFYWVLSFIALGLIAASIIPARANQDRAVRERITTLKQYLSAYDPELAADPSKRSVFEDELQTAQQNVEFRRNQLNTLTAAYNKSTYWLNYLKLLNTLRPEGSKVWFSSIETSVVSPGAPSNSGGGRPGGGAFGGPGRGPNKAGVNSSGMPPLTSGGRMGGGRLGGPGAGPAGGGQGQNPAEPAPVPRPNGFQIWGYAKDPEVLTMFVNRLKEEPSFKAGVYFDEANVEKVYITELDYARTPHGGGSKGTPAPLSEKRWETVVFFTLDLQTGPPPGDGQGQPGGAAPAPGGAAMKPGLLGLGRKRE